MTEYEIASLGLREAAVWVAIVQAAISLGVGSVQCVLIWRGLHFMRRAADGRDEGLKAQREADDKRHNEAMKALADRHAEAMQADERRHVEVTQADERRHAEVMQAFERQERESDRRHAEAMDAAERRERESLRRHEESMAALDAQRKGMETLIERTAPPRA